MASNSTGGYSSAAQQGKEELPMTMDVDLPGVEESVPAPKPAEVKTQINPEKMRDFPDNELPQVWEVTDEEAAIIRAQKSEPVVSQGDLGHEIEVKTAWGSHLDANMSLTTKQIDNHEVWLVDNLLSASECSALLKLAESHGFGKTSYPKAYRGNLRLMTTDPTLSEAVWRRLQPLVPTTLTLDGEAWDACGLNECWRLAKYYPGDVFKGHCDACFDRDNTDPPEMSMLTVNIYMNGGFQGGRTRFYFDRSKEADKNSAFAVTPDTGLCLLFRQPPGKAYFHDGEELGSGVKYLFRSDVMYRLRK